jgi:hypothetical protein
MTLINYWPSLEEIDNCIKSEAEALSDEVLLAVHQKFPLAFSKVGPDGKVISDIKSVATEEDLLRHLLGDAPEGTLVVPITGASGVGKSHLIRLLDARIRHRPDAQRYLVIRIPKSASLRRVVELILETEPLQGPEYNSVKAEFKTALADVSLDEAVIRFQAELNISLNEYAANLEQLVHQGQIDSVIREKLGHAKMLPKLIADAVNEVHFREKVFPRIIQRAVIGLKSERGEIKEVDPTEGQFKAEDLDLHHLNIGNASDMVAKYYRFNLEPRMGHGKSVAADVLNAVVDQATRQLYQLNRSLGGKTLAEVILAIRRQLLADKKDLVILVEDFAALVGIQDTLAKVLIQEGTSSKGKEYATIRSAIAVTDGYLAGRDTLATRVGKEWVVESRLDSEEEALRRTRLLVASYVNAARCGEARLRRHYQKVFEKIEGNDNPWSPPVYKDDKDEDEEALKAFGYEDDVPLFPFTKAAIECLARSALRSGNVLVFNPRFVIKNVIREVLVSGRNSFLNKQFPPPELQMGGVGADVDDWLSSLPVSEGLKQRYRRLVTIWGNRPQHRDDIGQIPGKVFEIFDLPKTDIKFVSKPKVIVKPPEPATADDSRLLAQKQAVEGISRALENWVVGGGNIKLAAAIANSIRKSLATLVNQRLDWNAERCLKQEISATRFSIPNASGEQGLAADPIKIAPSNEDTDGRLRKEIIALLRFFDVYAGDCNYDEVDEDLARIGNLYDRLLPDVLDRERSSVKRQSSVAIQALASNSRLLGLSERGRTPGAVASFLFDEVDAVEVLTEGAPQQFVKWRSMQNAALQIRPELRQLLLETCGCFQGNAKTVWGVDIIRLVENYPAENTKIGSADLLNIYDPKLKQSILDMTDSKVDALVNQTLHEANRIASAVQRDLGDQFDKDKVVEIVKVLSEKLRVGGTWRTEDIGFTANEFVQLCEKFRSAAVKECLALLQKVQEPEDDSEIKSKRVSRLAQLAFMPLVVTESFLEKAAKLVKYSNKYVQTLEFQFQGVKPAEKVREIQTVFDNLLADLVTLQEGGE